MGFFFVINFFVTINSYNEIFFPSLLLEVNHEIEKGSKEWNEGWMKNKLEGEVHHKMEGKMKWKGKYITMKWKKKYNKWVGRERKNKWKNKWWRGRIGSRDVIQMKFSNLWSDNPSDWIQKFADPSGLNPQSVCYIYYIYIAYSEIWFLTFFFISTVSFTWICYLTSFL